MPTTLPSRKIVRPVSTTSGTLVYVVAVLLMLVISAIMLMHPVAMGSDTALVQGF